MLQLSTHNAQTHGGKNRLSGAVASLCCRTARGRGNETIFTNSQPSSSKSQKVYIWSSDMVRAVMLNNEIFQPFPFV